MVFNSYAQRLLNPFRGVMNIIESGGAEAVTTDGMHWDIYVRDTALVEEFTNSHKVQTSDIRYGSWSARDGLKRGALYPSEDFKILEHRGALVYEHLLQHHQELPFPLTDNMELWLLDTAGAPLALLHSASREQDMELDCNIDWRAGRECSKYFEAPSLRELLPAQSDAISAGEYLTKYINARAGESPCAQWFRRNPDGSGNGMPGINLPALLEIRLLPAAAFPPCFLREEGVSPPHRRLIQDFIAWQSPWLLLLQDLGNAARQRFERLATARALTVDKHYRLYPEILDQEAIKAARVEAALRADELRVQEGEETMATYYIELNITRTN